MKLTYAQRAFMRLIHELGEQETSNSSATAITLERAGLIHGQETEERLTVWALTATGEALMTKNLAP